MQFIANYNKIKNKKRKEIKMVEIVVFHDMAEVIDGSSRTKKLVWMGTQTFTITHLEDDGKTIASSSLDIHQQQSFSDNYNYFNNNDDINDDYNINKSKKEECTIIRKTKNECHRLIRKDGIMILCSRYNEKYQNNNKQNEIQSNFNIDDTLRNASSLNLLTTTDTLSIPNDESNFITGNY